MFLFGISDLVLGIFLILVGPSDRGRSESISQ